MTCELVMSERAAASRAPPPGLVPAPEADAEPSRKGLVTTGTAQLVALLLQRPRHLGASLIGASSVVDKDELAVRLPATCVRHRTKASGVCFTLESPIWLELDLHGRGRSAIRPKCSHP